MKPSIILASDQLQVEIEQCGQPGQYAGARFDWTGFVKQVKLTGSGHTFCTRVSLVPGEEADGGGLCNEFGIGGPNGYEEAAPGESFLKIGVGALTRLSEAEYDFAEAYPIALSPVETEQGGDYIRYRSVSPTVNGYAYTYEKTVTVTGREVAIAYRLTNNGVKPITTTEYVHNFIAINSKPIGPDYVLRLPLAFANRDGFEPIDELVKPLQMDGDSMRWEPVTDIFYAQYSPAAEQVPFYWELKDEQTGAGLRESGSDPVAYYALWGNSHVVSPEAFVQVDLAPGETKCWTRSYTFFD
ncbi:conserved hypothetical protein [Paenibacillus curdlanolyticus YK9]|uniref:Aldose 1-epimerase n=1 Tax=Paenibacillus curdlanolyticus YK9 TaxID=717606 RepID=E0I8A8_9BACL|nr:hypothetical protein [Paenibacillus curdlanolyticus]EFM11413.1 conserved hypothetical protein [Paenibacillus curdlanolyticus YK9]